MTDNDPKTAVTRYVQAPCDGASGVARFAELAEALGHASHH
jgi:hypothetical protein